MPINVRLQCATCETNIIVMPPELFEAVGNFGGVEAEVQFAETLKTDEAQTGDRLAVADANRAFVCPECGARYTLPPEDEITRLTPEL